MPNQLKFYYLPFFVLSEIDYITLLAFYEIAEFDENKKIYDRIRYTTQKSLAQILGVSAYAVSQVFNSGKYSRYLNIDRENKIITIQNNFQKGSK